VESRSITKTLRSGRAARAHGRRRSCLHCPAGLPRLTTTAPPLSVRRGLIAPRL